MYHYTDPADIPVEDLGTNNTTIVIIKGRFEMMSGRKAHQVIPFTGEGVSFVFYTCQGYTNVPDDIRKQ